MTAATDAPLDELDRTVRRAAAAAAAWQSALARAPSPRLLAAEAPLGRFREVAGKSAFDALGGRVVPAADERHLAALRRWVGSLTVQRVTEDEHVDEAEAIADESARVELEEPQPTSFRGAWRGLLRARSAAEAGRWVQALDSRGGAVAGAIKHRTEREEEAVRRLGCDDWANVVGWEARSVLDGAATAFLQATRDLAAEVRAEARRESEDHTFAGVIRSAVAREATEGWPSRLTLRSVVATLGAPGDIGRGLRVAVTMPDPIGAASFARALASFGEAYRTAASVSGSQPFALAVDPYFVDALRYGFLFGALVTSVPYQRRGLGLGSVRAAGQARTLARTGLLFARGIAGASLLAHRVDRTRREEILLDVYGEGVPAQLARAFPRARLDASARLHALLTTLALAEQLRDTYDEDWFKNPLAWRFLRARASGPARGLAEDEPKVDPGALARAFEGALS